MIPRGILHHPLTQNLAYAGAIAALAVIATLVLASSCADPEFRYVTRTDTVEVAPLALLQEMEDLQLENRGLVARIRGLEPWAPKTVTVADTIIPACPAFVATGWPVESGEFAVGRMDAVQEDTAVGWRPSLPSGLDISDRDDGWSYGAAGLVCNRPRLGQLQLFAAGVAAVPFGAIAKLDPQDAWILGEAGLIWKPTFQSAIRLEILATTSATAELRSGSGAGSESGSYPVAPPRVAREVRNPPQVVLIALARDSRRKPGPRPPVVCLYTN